MHIADISVGMLGANGIVGGGAPLALGAALGARMDGAGHVAVAFSGDGACNQGTTFEAMNMAVVLRVPLIFAFENNHYSEHTGVRYAVGAKDIATRAAGFGMPALKADGCDFFESYQAMAEAVAHARADKGPMAIEFDTVRFFGHYEGDPQRYRGADELERNRETRDCLKHFRSSVAASRQLEASVLDRIDAEVGELIDAAIDEARKAPPPRADEVLQDVYITY